MSGEPQPSSQPSPMGLRHRGLTRAATVADGVDSRQPERRDSILSDYSVSEARNTIRASTDNLLFPRATNVRGDDARDEESNWQSAPLALALLPAIAGIFFRNGSAFVTDVTLLGLAAIFLNWSVRLPWEWYRSARTIRQQERIYGSSEHPVELEASEPQSPQPSNEPETIADHDIADKKDQRTTAAAAEELQVHELAALASCFIFPMIGTWLLHAIRSSLSRPSEGLVSNYNLTIFLLAAEIRPFAHLLKMVQARTLHLQRIVASSEDDKEKLDVNKVLDISKRLEEIEAHIAETAAARLAASPPSNGADNKPPTPEHTHGQGATEGECPLSPQAQEYTQSLITQATADFRNGFQQEIEALNRAVRRYEKRTALTSYETESRLGALETNVRDALSLAAAGRRSTVQRPRGLFALLLEWTSVAVLLPAQICISLAILPLRMARWGLLKCREVFREKMLSLKQNKGKAPQTRKPQYSMQKRVKRTAIVEE